MVAENFQNNVLHTMVIAFVLLQVFQVEAKMRLDPKRFARKRPEREMVRKPEEVERASGLEEERGRGGKGEGREEGQEGVGERRGDCTP